LIPLNLKLSLYLGSAYRIPLCEVMDTYSLELLNVSAILEILSSIWLISYFDAMIYIQYVDYGMFYDLYM